jgi:hypothetical protein
MATRVSQGPVCCFAKRRSGTAGFMSSGKIMLLRGCVVVETIMQ